MKPLGWLFAAVVIGLLAGELRRARRPDACVISTLSAAADRVSGVMWLVKIDVPATVLLSDVRGDAERSAT